MILKSWASVVLLCAKSLSASLDGRFLTIVPVYRLRHFMNFMLFNSHWCKLYYFIMSLNKLQLKKALGIIIKWIIYYLWRNFSTGQMVNIISVITMNKGKVSCSEKKIGIIPCLLFEHSKLSHLPRYFCFYWK